MTALLVLLPAAALGLLVALRAATGGEAERRQRWWALGALALPYLAAAGLLTFTEGARLLHLRLDGFLFALDGGRTLTVGGGGDDLTVPGWPAEVFRLEPVSGGFAVTPGPGHDGSQVVAVSGRWAGLAPLADGATVIAEGPDGTRREATFRQGGPFGASAALRWSDAAEGEERPLEIRGPSLPFLGFRLPALFFPSPRSRVYGLEELLPPGADGPGPGTSASGPTPASGPAPFRSVIGRFEDPSSEGEDRTNPLGILALDPSVTVDGEEVTPYPATAADGDSLTFARVVDGSRLIPALRIAEVRAYGSSLGLALARPRTLSVPWPEEGERLLLVGRGDAPSQNRLLRFSDLPRAFDGVAATFQRGEEGLKVESPQGVAEDLPWGRAVQLGGQDRLVVTPLAGPGRSRPLLLLLGTALLLVLLAGPWLDRLASLALLGTVALLSVDRVLFGWAAAAQPPFSGESLTLALWALPVLPGVVLAADALGRHLARALQRSPGNRSEAAGSGRGWRVLGAGLFGLLAPLPELLELSPGLRLGALLLPLTVLAVAACLLAWTSPGSSARGGGGRSRRSPAGEALRALRSSLGSLEGRLAKVLTPPSWKALFLAAGALYGLRLLLLALGQQESVTLGGSRVALSVLYVPALVVLLAWGAGRWLGTAARRSGPGASRATVRRELLSFTLFAGVVLALHLATGALAGDLGVFVYALPASVVLAALGLEGFAALGLREGRREALLLTVPMLVLLAALVVPLWVLRSGEVVLDKDLGASRLADRDAVVRDQKLLRLLQYTDPERIPEQGTRTAESMAQHLATMDAYTRRGLLGEGFLGAPVAPALGATALNDNVAAVYVLGQFGLLGALALIFTYGLPLLAGGAVGGSAARRPLGSTADGAARAGAVLAVVVFSGSSLYILAANAGLLPFTGRNLYLLGLNSLSDLYEGGLLLALAALAAAFTLEASPERRPSPGPRSAPSEAERNEPGGAGELPPDEAAPDTSPDTTPRSTPRSTPYSTTSEADP